MNQNKGTAINNIPLINKFFKEFDELPMRTEFDCRIELKGELPIKSTDIDNIQRTKWIT
jgi:hypothetical protein